MSRNKKRRPDQTTVTISMPKSLKSKLQDAAQKENRTLSNFIVTRLQALIAMPPTKNGDGAGEGGAGSGDSSRTLCDLQL